MISFKTGSVRHETVVPVRPLHWFVNKDLSLIHWNDFCTIYCFSSSLNWYDVIRRFEAQLTSFILSGFFGLLVLKENVNELVSLGKQSQWMNWFSSQVFNRWTDASVSLARALYTGAAGTRGTCGSRPKEATSKQTEMTRTMRHITQAPPSRDLVQMVMRRCYVHPSTSY
jgi:hypothetical protein